MFLKLFNTINRKSQNFTLANSRLVKIYACGPTVYDRVHIGNLRTFIFEDILRRTLEYNGLRVKQVMNITDIEDKIIKKALNSPSGQKKDIYQITAPYTKIFFDDLKKLNIEKAEFYPRATKHIKEMVVLIGKLLKNEIAYYGEDGSIYFNISKFKNYGRLSQLEKRELKAGARVSADEYKKEEAQDFVLWKSAEKNIGEKTDLKKIKAVWKSPFGEGRPGWHIECSAMAKKYLGDTLDIHAGGVDLIFPHHENEIAQSEAASGKKFANFWLHGEHLLINNERMSKSLGNFLTLHDLEINTKFSPLAFRYLVLTTHYRSKLNFTWEGLTAAQNGLNNLKEEFIRACISGGTGRSLAPAASNYSKKFLLAINDDLNTPQALAVVWQVVKDKNLMPEIKKELLLDFDRVLGLGLAKIKPRKSLKIPLKIKQKAEEREQFRKNQQFIHADALRKKIEELGYEIEDTKDGPKITPAKR